MFKNYFEMCIDYCYAYWFDLGVYGVCFFIGLIISVVRFYYDECMGG